MQCYHRLRDLREDADQKQETIANLLGTSQTLYRRWERGEREIPFHHIITLALFYRCSIDYIAGLTNKKTKAGDHISTI
jgi:transcriptional regulator with XRE-family HTH domain